MEHQGELGRLEKIIERLLSGFNDLKQEKILLLERVKRQEEELLVLRKELETLRDEKNEVHKRVADLILSIEDWEESNKVGEDESVDSTPAGASPKGGEESGGQLFGLAG